MPDILKNPMLMGHTTIAYFTETNGQVGVIEYPDGWEYTYSPLHPEDPNRIAQSLHHEQGFVISASGRKWEGGYVQRGVSLRQGQRYRAKATFLPAVTFAPGHSPAAGFTDVQWQFSVDTGQERVFSGWTSTTRGGYNQREEHSLVIEAASDLSVDVYFKVRCERPAAQCEFHVHRVSLEEVGSGVGAQHIIGRRVAAAVAAASRPQASIPPPAAVLNVTPLVPLRALPGVLAGASTARKTLVEVITKDDIEIISAGLREAARYTAHEKISAAFSRLADVLERMKK